MCQSPWSGKDEFQLYPDCHIWTPLYTIFNTLVLAHAVLNLVVSTWRIFRNGVSLKTSAMPAIVWIAAFTTIIACCLRLSLKLSTVDNNVGHNLLVAISRTCLWLTVFQFQGKMIEVVFYVKARFSGEHIERALAFYRFFGVWFLSVMATVWEFITFLGPIIAPQAINYRIAFFSHIFASSVIAFVITLVFTIRVRRLLISMEVSNKLYAEVRGNIDYLLKNAVGLSVYIIPLCIVSMVVEAMKRWNMVMFFLIWFSAENLVLVLLFGSSPVDQNSGSRKKTTDVPLTHTPDKDQQKETISSSGVHHPESIHAPAGTDSEAVSLTPTSEPSPPTSPDGRIIFNPF